MFHTRWVLLVLCVVLSALIALLERCFAEDADRRPRDAGAFARELALAREPAGATRVSAS